VNLTCSPPDAVVWNHTCVNCTEDLECLSSQICNLTLHKCENLTCIEGYFPENHTCEINWTYCPDITNCPAGYQCNNSAHACEPISGYCDNDSDCITGERCAGNNRCVNTTLNESNCTVDSDCKVGYYCNNTTGNCTPIPGYCDSPNDCEDNQVCNKSNKCENLTIIQNNYTGKIYYFINHTYTIHQCLNNSHCDSKQICNVTGAINVCEDLTCDYWQVAENHECQCCVSGYCGNDADCGSGKKCVNHICKNSGGNGGGGGSSGASGFYYGTCNSDGIDCTDDIYTGGRCQHLPDSSKCPNDGWYDTSKTQWAEDAGYVEKKQKEQEYRDYYCSISSGCKYDVTETRWLDTGEKRNTTESLKIILPDTIVPHREFTIHVKDKSGADVSADVTIYGSGGKALMNFENSAGGTKIKIEEEGNYRLRASKEGYESTEAEFTVKSLSDLVVTLSDFESGKTGQITVTDRQGNPVDAKVTIVYEDGSKSDYNSGEDGKLSVPLPFAMSRAVIITEAENYKPVEVSVEIPGHLHIIIPDVVSRGSEFEIKVTDASGNVVPGVKIIIIDGDIKYEKIAHGGKMKVTLKTTDVTISAQKEGYSGDIITPQFKSDIFGKLLALAGLLLLIGLLLIVIFQVIGKRPGKKKRSLTTIRDEYFRKGF